MSNDIRKTAADMARHSIAELSCVLREADQYLQDGREMAAWGTLLSFDEAAEDLRAAIRLHRSANRRTA